MSRKELFMVLLAVGLGAVYVVFFTDLFAKKSLQIIPLIRTGRQSAIPREHDSPAVYPVAFQLKGKHPLKSIKVVDDAE